MKWALLAAAITSEVIATISLKYSEGFTRWLPSAVVVVGYLSSFFLLAKVLQSGIPIGVVYAIWSAVGVLLVTVLGLFLFNERLTSLQLGGLVMVIVGVIALQAGTATAASQP